MVFIVGGSYQSSHGKGPKRYLQTIFYAKSNDLNPVPAWEMSKILLPFQIKCCECIITEKNTNDPTLVILGGQDSADSNCRNYWEYKISEVVGDQYLKQFMDNSNDFSQRVNPLYIYICVCVCSFFFLIFCF